MRLVGIRFSAGSAVLMGGDMAISTKPDAFFRPTSKRPDEDSNLDLAVRPLRLYLLSYPAYQKHQSIGLFRPNNLRFSHSQTLNRINIPVAA